MAIEIREIIIKTEISSNQLARTVENADQDLDLMKKQLLEECKKIIAESLRKNNYKR